jgi:hypothetical protein
MAKHIERRPSGKSGPPNIDIQIERWPIERLIPRANNPRNYRHSRVEAHSLATVYGRRRLSRQSKFVHDPLCSPREVA